MQEINTFRKYRNVLKVIALVVAVIFSYEQIIWASGGVGEITKTSSASIDLPAANDLGHINVSEKIAATDDSYYTGGDDLVINIQDCHSSLSAQYSIVKVLKDLLENYELDLVAIEGADGYIDTSLLNTFPDHKIREKTASHFMKEGKLSAGEFFSATTDADIALYGVEDNELYQANLKAFRDIYATNRSKISSLNKILKQLRPHETKIYSPDLKKFVYKQRLHRQGRISFDVYWNFLEKQCASLSIDKERFQAIKRFNGSIALEKNIDFDRATEERKQLINELMGTMDKLEVEDLVISSLAFEKGKMDQREYHVLLMDIAERKQLDLEKYEHLLKYVDYLKRYQRLNIIDLHIELKALESEMTDVLITTKSQRELYRYIKFFELLKGLFEIKLNDEEVDLLRDELSKFTPRELEGYAREKLDDASKKIEAESLLLEAKEAITFYDLAEERNHVMLSNTVKNMRREGKRVAALISGGHHSSGLTDLMKEKGLSYLVLMPKFNNDRSRPYVAVLTKKAGPYRELAQSGAYDLALEAYFDTGDLAELEELMAFAIGQSFLAGADIEAQIEDWINAYAKAYDAVPHERRQAMSSKPLIPGDLKVNLMSVRTFRRTDGSCEVTIDGNKYHVASDEITPLEVRRRVQPFEKKRIVKGTYIYLKDIFSRIRDEAGKFTDEEVLGTLSRISHGVNMSNLHILMHSMTGIGSSLGMISLAWAAVRLREKIEVHKESMRVQRLAGKHGIKLTPEDEDDLVKGYFRDITEELVELGEKLGLDESFLGRLYRPAKFLWAMRKLSQIKNMEEYGQDTSGMPRREELERFLRDGAELEATEWHFHTLREHPRDLMTMSRSERLSMSRNYTGKYRDMDYVQQHIGRVSDLAKMIAEKIGLSSDLIRILVAAAQSHDGVYIDPDAFEKILGYYGGSFHGGKKLDDEDRKRFPEAYSFTQYLKDQKGADLTTEEVRLARDLYNHGGRAVEDIKALNIEMPVEVELLIKYHQTPSEYFAQKELFGNQLTIASEDMDLLFAILLTADILETGNNVDKMKLFRGGRPAEPFGRTFEFLEKTYKRERIDDRRALRALADLIVDEDEEFLSVIAEARRSAELTEDDREFIDTYRSKGRPDPEYLDPVFKELNIIPSYTVDTRLERSERDIPHPYNLEVPHIHPGIAAELQKNGLMKVRGKTFHLMHVSMEDGPQRALLNLSGADAENIIASPFIYNMLDETGCEGPVSVHIGFGGENVERSESGEIIVTGRISEEEAFSRIVQNVRLLKQKLRSTGHNNRVLLGNSDYFEGNRHVLKPEFIRRVARETDSGLLLDLGHIITASLRENSEMTGEGANSPLAYMKRLIDEKNINKLEEVHISIPVFSEEDNLWKHSGKYGFSPLLFSGSTEGARMVKNLLQHLLDLRKATGTTKPLIVNFETSDTSSRKEVQELSNMLMSWRDKKLTGIYVKQDDYISDEELNKIMSSFAFKRTEGVCGIQPVLNNTDEKFSRYHHITRVASAAAEVSRYVHRDVDSRTVQGIALLHDMGRLPFAAIGERAARKVIGDFDMNDLMTMSLNASGIEIPAVILEDMKAMQRGEEPIMAEARIVEVADSIVNIAEDVLFGLVGGHITAENIPREFLDIFTLYEIDRIKKRAEVNFDAATLTLVRSFLAAGRVDPDTITIPEKRVLENLTETFVKPQIWEVIDSRREEDVLRIMQNIYDIIKTDNTGKSDEMMDQLFLEKLLEITDKQAVQFSKNLPPPGASGFGGIIGRIMPFILVMILNMALSMPLKAEEPPADNARAVAAKVVDTLKVPGNIDVKADYPEKLQDAMVINGYAVSKVYADRSREDKRNAFFVVLALADHESGGFKWRKNLKGGPDRGLSQVRMQDAKNIVNYIIDHRVDTIGPDLAVAIEEIFESVYGNRMHYRHMKLISPEQWGHHLVRSDALAFALAAARIRWDERPLPRREDHKTLESYADALAEYWLNVYNRATSRDKRRALKEQMAANTLALLETIEEEGYSVLSPEDETPWQVTASGLVVPDTAVPSRAYESVSEVTAVSDTSFPRKAERAEDDDTLVVSDLRASSGRRMTASLLMFFVGLFGMIWSAVKIWRSLAPPKTLDEFLARNIGGSTFEVELDTDLLSDHETMKKLVTKSKREVFIGHMQVDEEPGDKKKYIVGTNKYIFKLGEKSWMSGVEAFTGEERRYKWVGHVHPEINKNEFDDLPSYTDLRQKYQFESRLDGTYYYSPLSKPAGRAQKDQEGRRPFNAEGTFYVIHTRGVTVYSTDPDLVDLGYDAKMDKLEASGKDERTLLERAVETLDAAEEDFMKETRGKTNEQISRMFHDRLRVIVYFHEVDLSSRQQRALDKVKDILNKALEMINKLVIPSGRMTERTLSDDTHYFSAGKAKVLGLSAFATSVLFIGLASLPYIFVENFFTAGVISATLFSLSLYSVRASLVYKRLRDEVYEAFIRLGVSRNKAETVSPTAHRALSALSEHTRQVIELYERHPVLSLPVVSSVMIMIKRFLFAADVKIRMKMAPQGRSEYIHAFDWGIAMKWGRRSAATALGSAIFGLWQSGLISTGSMPYLHMTISTLSLFTSAYLMIAAYRYLFLGQAIFKAFKQDGLSDEEARKTPIAKRFDDGRIDVHKAFAHLPDRMKETILMHDVFKTDFWGMVFIAPIVDKIIPLIVERRVMEEVRILAFGQESFSGLEYRLRDLLKESGFASTADDWHLENMSGLYKQWNTWRKTAGTTRLVKATSTGIFKKRDVKNINGWEFSIDSNSTYPLHIEARSENISRPGVSGKIQYQELLDMFSCLDAGRKILWGNRVSLEPGKGFCVDIFESGTGEESYRNRKYGIPPLPIEKYDLMPLCRSRRDQGIIYVVKDYPASDNPILALAVKGKLQDTELLAARCSDIEKIAANENWVVDKMFSKNESDEVTVYFYFRKPYLPSSSTKDSPVVGPLAISGLWTLHGQKNFETFSITEAKDLLQTNTASQKSSDAAHILGTIRRNFYETEGVGLLPPVVYFNLFEGEEPKKEDDTVSLIDGLKLVTQKTKVIDRLWELGVRRLNFLLKLSDEGIADKARLRVLRQLLEHARRKGMTTGISSEAFLYKVDKLTQNWEAIERDILPFVDKIAFKVKPSQSDNPNLDNLLTRIKHNFAGKSVEVITPLREGELNTVSLEEPAIHVLGRKLNMQLSQMPGFVWTINYSKALTGEAKDEKAILDSIGILLAEFPLLNINTVSEPRNSSRLYVSAEGKIGIMDKPEIRNFADLFEEETLSQKMSLAVFGKVTDQIRRQSRFVPRRGLTLLFAIEEFISYRLYVNNANLTMAANLKEKKKLFLEVLPTILGKEKLEEVDIDMVEDIFRGDTEIAMKKKYGEEFASLKTAVMQRVFPNEQESLNSMGNAEQIINDLRSAYGDRPITRHIDWKVQVAMALARKLGLSEKDIDLLRMALWAYDLDNYLKEDISSSEIRALLLRMYPEENYVKDAARRFIKDRAPDAKTDGDKLSRFLEELSSLLGRSLNDIEKKIAIRIFDPSAYAADALEKYDIELPAEAMLLLEYYGKFAEYLTASSKDLEKYSVEPDRSSNIASLIAITKVVSIFVYGNDVDMQGRKGRGIEPFPHTIEFLVEELRSIPRGEKMAQALRALLYLLKEDNDLVMNTVVEARGADWNYLQPEDDAFVSFLKKEENIPLTEVDKVVGKFHDSGRKITAGLYAEWAKQSLIFATVSAGLMALVNVGAGIFLMLTASFFFYVAYKFWTISSDIRSAMRKSFDKEYRFIAETVLQRLDGYDGGREWHTPHNIKKAVIMIANDVLFKGQNKQQDTSIEALYHSVLKAKETEEHLLYQHFERDVSERMARSRLDIYESGDELNYVQKKILRALFDSIDHGIYDEEDGERDELEALDLAEVSRGIENTPIANLMPTGFLDYHSCAAAFKILPAHSRWRIDLNELSGGSPNLLKAIIVHSIPYLPLLRSNKKLRAINEKKRPIVSYEGLKMRPGRDNKVILDDGKWKWVKGAGLGLTLGLEKADTKNKSSKRPGVYEVLETIQDELEEIVPDKTKLRLISPENIYIELAKLEATTRDTLISSDRQMRRDAKRNAVLWLVKKVFSGANKKIKLRFNLDDITITEEGNIVVMGTLRNSLWDMINAMLQHNIGIACETPIALEIGKILDDKMDFATFFKLREKILAYQKGEKSIRGAREFNLDSKDLRLFDQSQDSERKKFEKILEEKSGFDLFRWAKSLREYVKGISFSPVKLFKLLLFKVASKKKILLIQSPLLGVSFREADKRGGVFVSPPYGLYRMKSYLERNGVAEVEVFDPNLYPEDAMERARKLVREGQFDIVGFSLTHVNMGDEIRWIEGLRAEAEGRGRKAPIFIGGGNEATHNYKEWIRHSSLDGVVLGYGEKIVEEMVKRIARSESPIVNAKKGDKLRTFWKVLFNFIIGRQAPPEDAANILRGIPGIAFRHEKGGVYREYAEPVNEDVFRELAFKYAPTRYIPYNDYWDINKANFDPENMAARGATIKTIRLFTSSHCTNNCGFCSSCNFMQAATGKKDRVATLRLKPEEVFELVLRSVKEHNPEGIFFNDDDFIIDRGDGLARVKKFSAMIVKAKEMGMLPMDLKFYCQTKVRNVTKQRSVDGVTKFVADEELLSAMEKAGFVLVALGVESFSDKILNQPSINKKITAERAQVAIEGIRQAGIMPLMNIIMLPPEVTFNDFDETAEMVKIFVKKGAQLSLSPFVDWFPGSKISRKVAEGEYVYTRGQAYSGRENRMFEYPVTILPSDESMRKVAFDLERMSTIILTELKKDPEWIYKYPPQLIRGLTYIAAVYKLLQVPSSAEEIIELIKDISRYSSRSRITGTVLSIDQYNNLILRSRELMETREMSLEKARILLYIAGDLKLSNPKRFRQIINYLSEYVKSVIDKKKDLKERGEVIEPQDAADKKELRTVRFIADKLAEMDVRSSDTDRLLALLNFYNIKKDIRVLEDFYVNEENIVTFQPAGADLFRDESMKNEFSGSRVLVFEPHQDDAIIQLGNTLENNIVPEAEEVMLVSLFNDVEGVTDEFAKADPSMKGEDRIEGMSLYEAKRFIRTREGESYAELLGIKYKDMRFKVKLDPEREEKGSDGRMLAYHSVFSRPGDKEVSKAKRLIAEFKPKALIVPYPKGGYHQTHRDAAWVIIAAFLEYKRDEAEKGRDADDVKLYLYGSNIARNGFTAYGIKPNMVNFFGSTEEARKEEQFRLIYSSQFTRNPRYPELINALGLNTSKEVADLLEEEDVEVEPFAETLLRVDMVESDQFKKEKQEREQNKIHNSVRILLHRVERMLKARHGGDAENDLLDGLSGSSGTKDEKLRIRILDNNIFFDIGEEFDFLTVAVEGSRITDYLKKANIISIVVDPPQGDENVLRIERVLTELIEALYDDDEGKLQDILRSEPANEVLKVEIFSKNVRDASPDIYQGMSLMFWQDNMYKKLKGKDEVVISGHQPGYHYYMGNFYKIGQADVFTFSDIFEFRKANWQNRQIFPGANGKKEWLTVPVKHSPEGPQKIRDKMIASDDIDWKNLHLHKINEAYKEEEYFAEYSAFIEELYSREWTSLVALNEAITRFVAKKLGIDTLLIRTSLMGMGEDIGRKVGAIENLVATVAGDKLLNEATQKVVYLSGPAGRSYLEQFDDNGVYQTDLLRGRGIDVDYVEYPAHEISLLGMNPYASGLEILFQLGPDARDIIENRIDIRGVRRSISLLQKIAMKYVEKTRVYELSKTELTADEKMDLEYYTTLLEFIYTKMQKLHDKDQEIVPPIVIDAEVPLDEYVPVKKEVDAEDGKGHLYNDIIDQIGKWRDDHVDGLAEVIVIGEYADHYQKVIDQDLRMRNGIDNSLGKIQVFKRERKSPEDVEYSLPENELIQMYDEKGLSLRPQIKKDQGDISQAGYVLMAAGSGTRLAQIFKMPYEDRVELGLEDIDPENIKDYAKSTFPLTRLRHKSPFILIFESLAAIARDNEADVPVVVVCTSSNRSVIEEILNKNDYFGLKNVVLKEDIPGPPVFGNHGRVTYDVILSGGGTGGTLRTLNDKGGTIGSTKEVLEDKSPLDWFASKGVKDICFLQCDMPYNEDILTALATVKNDGEGRMDLFALGYSYPQEKEKGKHKYELGTILKLEKSTEKEISAQEKTQMIEKAAYYIDERLRREAEAEGKIYVPDAAKNWKLARAQIERRLKTSYQVVEYRDRSREIKDLISQVEHDGRAENVAAYAGGLRIDIDLARSFVEKNMFMPEIHWDKMEKRHDGMRLRVNKIQYSLTDLFRAVDRMGVLMVPFEKVSPMKDPEKLSFIRYSLVDLDKAALRDLSGMEISDTAMVEISPLAELNVGHNCRILDNSKIYFGGKLDDEGNSPSINIGNNVIIDGSVTVEIDSTGDVEIGDNVIFSGNGKILIGREDKGLVVIPTGASIMNTKKGEVWRFSTETGEHKLESVDRSKGDEVLEEEILLAEEDDYMEAIEKSADNIRYPESDATREFLTERLQLLEMILWGVSASSIVAATVSWSLFPGFWKMIPSLIMMFGAFSGVSSLLLRIERRLNARSDKEKKEQEKVLRVSDLMSSEADEEAEEVSIFLGIEESLYERLGGDEGVRRIIDELSGIDEAVAITSGTEQEMMAQLEEYDEVESFMTLLIGADSVEQQLEGAPARKELISIVSDFKEKMAKEILPMMDAKVSKITEEDVRLIEDIEQLKEVMGVILRLMPRGRSYRLSEQSIYQIRIEKAYKDLQQEGNLTGNVEYLNAADSGTEVKYLAHFADWGEVTSREELSIIPPGLEIEKRRTEQRVIRQIDTYKDRFFIVAPEGVDVNDREQLESFTEEVMVHWMLEGVVDKRDVVILEKKRGGYSTSDIFARLKTLQVKKQEVNANNTGVRSIAGELEYDKKAEEYGILQVNTAEGAQSTINMYEVMINLLVSRSAGTGSYNVPGLQLIDGGLYIYFPPARPIDLEVEIRKYYDRFVEEVAIKA